MEQKQLENTNKSQTILEFKEEKIYEEEKGFVDKDKLDSKSKKIKKTKKKSFNPSLVFRNYTKFILGCIRKIYYKSQSYSFENFISPVISTLSLNESEIQLILSNSESLFREQQHFTNRDMIFWVNSH